MTINVEQELSDTKHMHMVLFTRADLGKTRLKGFSLQPRELSVLTSLVEEELSVSGLWHNITILWPNTSSLLHSASSLWLDTSIQWLSTISLRLSTSSLQQNSKKLRIGTSGLWLKG